MVLRLRAVALTIAAMAFGACGSRQTQPESPEITPVKIAPIATAPPTSSAPELLLASNPPVSRVACPAPSAPTPNELAARTAIAKKILGGQAAEAVGDAERLLDAAPADRGAFLMRNAARAAQERAHEDAAESSGAISPVSLAAIPLSATHVADAHVSGPLIALTLESEKPNLITDDADYLKRNGLAHPRARSFTGMPDDVAVFHEARSAHVGLAGVRDGSPRWVFDNGTHHVAYYVLQQGSRLIASAPGKAPRVFDVHAPESSGPRPFEIFYAAIAGDALYVQFAFNGYSKDARGKNGYLAAFDLERGTLLFSSDPLVGGMTNFTVVGGSVITGFGFTAEPDSLSVLDAKTGKVTQKIRLPKSPESIIAKGDRLYVRTYDKDMVFKMSAADAPTAPSFTASVALTSPSDADVCWLLTAASALDKNDTDAAVSAAHELARTLSRQDVPSAIETLANEAKSARYDVQSVPPVALAVPPWRGVTLKPARGASGRVPTIARKGDAPPDARAEHEPGYGIERTRWSKILAEKHGVPEEYGLAHLSDVFVSADEMILVYGGRYVALVSGPKTQRVFDLDGFLHPPDPNPAWKQFADNEVTHAQVVDGVLYVCNGGGSYAREVHGKKAFMSALDASTGELLWRSDPLVCGHDFVIEGGGIVTGYGFTDEPDYVFLLDRATGRTKQRLPIESAPDHFEMLPSGGGRMLVETYAKRHLFLVK
jgi:outer membrane protein assembly factor BamB